MRRITEILDADANNAKAALEILRAFDADLVDVLETVGELFERYNACVGDSFSSLDQQGEQELYAAAKKLGVTPEALIDRMNGTDPDFQESRGPWRAMRVREAKKFVLLLLHRYFRWGLSNMLYLRVTPVLGYGRLQAEATALLRLFLDDPQRGEQWLRTGLSEEGGRKFYKATQGSIRKLLKQHGLEREYERGSAAYQHVRLNSAHRGLSITDEGAELRDQEFDPKRPAGFYRIVLWFLSVQVKVFAALLTAVPEVRCDGWRDRVEAFARRVDALWRLLDKRYPLEGTDEGE